MTDHIHIEADAHSSAAPHPMGSFEDTTHAYETGYATGLAAGQRENAKPAIAKIDHPSAAADMLAAWNEWFSGFGGDKEKADRLARAACFAYEAVRQDDDPDTAPQALMCAFLQAMIDPLHEDLDYLRADPKSGAVARAKIAAAQIGGAA